MKIINLLFLAILFFIISCQYKNKKVDFEQDTVSLKVFQDDKSDEKQQGLLLINMEKQLEEPKNKMKNLDNGIDSSNIILENLTIERLQGVWFENDVDNALFYIENDLLYYTEDQDNPVQITIYKDTLIIKGDTFVKCKVIKLDKDSLCFIDEINMDVTRLKRIK